MEIVYQDLCVKLGTLVARVWPHLLLVSWDQFDGCRPIVELNRHRLKEGRMRKF